MTQWCGGAPWFKAPFMRILRREFAIVTRFDDSVPAAPIAAPSAPCQLYVHVPFCESLCPFCSFQRVRYREDKARVYFEMLRREIRLYRDRGFIFADVYVGGGTPTVSPRELGETLRLIRACWPIRTLSVETNPNHLRPDVLDVLQSAGLDRLSVGVQSFDDALLRAMKRYEPYGSGTQIAARLAAARGRFPTLNVDMIFNFAQQSRESLERDLAIVRDLDVDQVSFYPLMTSASTARPIEKNLGIADPGRAFEYYGRILERLRPAYEPSSAWCFSRAASGPGPRSIDEYVTQQDEYVGVGSGAFSYVGGRMYSTTFSLNRYRERIAAGESGITDCKVLTLKQRMRYDFLVRMFGLSLPYAFIAAKYGRSFWWRMAPELAAMRLIGAIRFDPDAIRLTERGMYCWMVMMSEFFTAVNTFRDQMRLRIRTEGRRPAAADLVPAVRGAGAT